jgi:O-antigen ligase
MSPDAVFDRLNTRPFIFGAMVICALFVFTTKVVYIPSIKYFITEVLNRDITLTGRQQIFDIIPKIISQRPLLGYGSSSMIISKYTGAYDAQNGFFDMVVCNGFPSAVLYVLLITGMIRRKSSIAAKILIGGIYAYIFMSMAEVTYGSTMIFLCALLMTESSLYCDQNVQILEKESVFSFQLF